jgi:DNA-3-methyladenine glycosylase I
MERCSWANGDDALLRDYHDNEYGRRKNNDQALFEKLCLEIFQAGLSWRTVLYKRDALRASFYGFDIGRMAKMTTDDVEVLMQEPRIIRNRRKIEAVIHNARMYLVQFPNEGDFVRYVYAFTDGGGMAADLKERGFFFIGPTICTSLLMSVGAVCGHEKTCFYYKGD